LYNEKRKKTEGRSQKTEVKARRSAALLPRDEAFILSPDS
jgi:hypothetical protein